MVTTTYLALVATLGHGISGTPAVAGQHDGWEPVGRWEVTSIQTTPFIKWLAMGQSGREARAYITPLDPTRSLSFFLSSVLFIFWEGHSLSCEELLRYGSSY